MDYKKTPQQLMRDTAATLVAAGLVGINLQANYQWLKNWEYV